MSNLLCWIWPYIQDDRFHCNICEICLLQIIGRYIINVQLRNISRDVFRHAVTQLTLTSSLRIIRSMPWKEVQPFVLIINHACSAWRKELKYVLLIDRGNKKRFDWDNSYSLVSDIRSAIKSASLCILFPSTNNNVIFNRELLIYGLSHMYFIEYSHNLMRSSGRAGTT
jgi:hypothetical protein